MRSSVKFSESFEGMPQMQLGFGSTTGNLWVTADQGDSWHQVSGTLPPIYAVRYL